MFGTGIALYIGIRKKERKKMEKSTSVNSFIRSLPPVYTHDNIVHMKNGKAYRVYRCGSLGAVYRYMRSQGFDTNDIVRVDLVPAKNRD